MAIRILVCRLPWFYLSCPVSSSTLTFPPPLTASHFLQTIAGMARKKITGNELSAHVKANGYRRDTHRDKNSLRDRNKLGDMVKKDQDAALDLLCAASRSDCGTLLIVYLPGQRGDTYRHKEMRSPQRLTFCMTQMIQVFKRLSETLSSLPTQLTHTDPPTETRPAHNSLLEYI